MSPTQSMERRRALDDLGEDLDSDLCNVCGVIGQRLYGRNLLSISRTAEDLDDACYQVSCEIGHTKSPEQIRHILIKEAPNICNAINRTKYL